MTEASAVRTTSSVRLLIMTTATASRPSTEPAPAVAFVIAITLPARGTGDRSGPAPVVAGRQRANRLRGRPGHQRSRWNIPHDHRSRGDDSMVADRDPGQDDRHPPDPHVAADGHRGTADARALLDRVVLRVV